MAYSTHAVLAACCAAGALTCASAARAPDLQPIDICLTVGHPDPCVHFSDAQGDGWAIMDMAPGYNFPNFPDGTQFRIVGMYCASCIYWFCGNFEGNIFDAQIAPSCILGDVNGNGSVNIEDLMAVLGAWGQCPAPCLPDLNGDQTVNIIDLMTVISHWS